MESPRCVLHDASFSTHIEAYSEFNTIFKSNNVCQCRYIAVMMQHFGFGKQDMCFFPLTSPLPFLHKAKYTHEYMEAIYQP